MNGEKPQELNEECLTLVNSLHFLLLPFHFLLFTLSLCGKTAKIAS